MFVVILPGKGFSIGKRGELQAKYARDVLTDEMAIKGKVALEGARIISITEEDFTPAAAGYAIYPVLPIGRDGYVEVALDEETMSKLNYEIDPYERRRFSNRDAKILPESIGLKFTWMKRLLTDEAAIKAGVALEGARVISGAKEIFNVGNAGCVLTNEEAIKAGIAVEGAKIISESREAFQALIARDVLTSEAAIKKRIALEGAKIINESDERFKADYVSAILRDETAVNAEISLSAAKAINHSNREFDAQIILAEFGLGSIYDNKEPSKIFKLMSEIQKEDETDIEPSSLVKRLVKENPKLPNA